MSATNDPTNSHPVPLQPATFHILLALADQDRHGYAIMRDVAARTGGKFKFNPGTLYTNIKRLMLDGWIVESEERPEPEEDDERRRYYRITPQGRAAAEAELRRLQEIVADAAAVLFAKG